MKEKLFFMQHTFGKPVEKNISEKYFQCLTISTNVFSKVWFQFCYIVANREIYDI